MSDTEESPTPAKVARLSSSVTEISSDPDIPEPSSQDSENERTFELQEISNCQVDIDVLYEKGSEEVLQVEMKYNKLRRPHFEKRNHLIRQIPNFWVTSVSFTCNCCLFLNQSTHFAFKESEQFDILHYVNS